jgi:thiol-disulfide isomerase/thioredoxin
MRWLIVALLMILVGCSNQSPRDLSDELETPVKAEAPELPDQGPAPDIGGDVWLNSPVSLSLLDLRGKVVLLEMWTFGCINCQRVIPYLNQWQSRYADEGLVIIGNHYPEFRYEEDLGNLNEAVAAMDIEYPVVQDNQGINWRAYRNRYWPTLYLIDKSGNLRYQHIGEGRYGETESAIQALLDEPSGAED